MTDDMIALILLYILDEDDVVYGFYGLVGVFSGYDNGPLHDSSTCDSERLNAAGIIGCIQ